MKRNNLILGPLLLLTGCGMYAETFDCDPGKGVGCLALHKVDAQVDQKALPFQVEEAEAQRLQGNPFQEEVSDLEGSEVMPMVPSSKNTSVANTLSSVSPLPPSFKEALPLSGPFPLPLTQEPSRQRLPEQSLKVWIAPYEDAAGHFHEAAIVHVVTHPGQWSVR